MPVLLEHIVKRNRNSMATDGERTERKFKSQVWIAT